MLNKIKSQSNVVNNVDFLTPARMISSQASFGNYAFLGRQVSMGYSMENNAFNEDNEVMMIMMMMMMMMMMMKVRLTQIKTLIKIYYIPVQMLILHLIYLVCHYPQIIYQSFHLHFQIYLHLVLCLQILPKVR